MEKHSSSFSKLAVFAFLLLTISGPVLGSNMLRMEASSNNNDINDANTMKEAIMKEIVAKEELIAAYNNYKQQMVSSSRKLGLNEGAMGKPLKCLEPGTPCIMFGTPCCTSCFPSVGGICLPRFSSTPLQV